MIIFDASYLVVFLNKSPAPATDRQGKPVVQFKERVDYLASSLNSSGEQIGIPTPAMAEVLVRAGKGRSQFVAVLSDRMRFQIVPFDARGAIEAAELIALIKRNNENWGTHAKVKFDIQIVATAKAEDAITIYSDDQDIERFAKRLKIPVIRICDLPLPPPPAPPEIESGPIGEQRKLFDAAPQKGPSSEEVANNKSTAPQPDNVQATGTQVDDESQATTASVRGSNGERAPSEADNITAENPKEAGMRPCECGCGQYPKDPKSRFLPGHDLRKAYSDQKLPNTPS